jgi:hypothetical protein
VSTRSGPVAGLELTLIPLGRVVLRVVRDDWGELRAELLDASGSPRVARRIHGRRPCALDAPRGTYDK